MRAFGCFLAASLALAGCAAPPPPAPAEAKAAPQRVVSLNLCTDELLLLLAEPRQIASLSHLAGREDELPLWREARAYPANDGSLASAAALRPDLVLTMGGGGDRLQISRRLGIPAVNLPFPQSLDDVERSVRTVGAALRRGEQAAALVSRMAALRRSAPPARTDTLWIGGGGRTVAAQGLEAQWMALAGYRQRSISGDQVQLEELLARPPAVLLRSDYRQHQYSRAQAWLAHPLAQAADRSRTLATDGRRWTCLGPLMIEEIEQLRREAGA
jgi:iron complex transport system substrate-binding protein